MTLIGLICMASACLILAVALCFVKNHKTAGFLLRTGLLIAVTCFGIVSATYGKIFSGYSILLILSSLPIFLSLFDLKGFLAEKQAKSLEKPFDDANWQEDFEENQNEDKKQKHLFQNSNGSLINSICLLISAICIGFAGLYIGTETAYGFLIGLAIACASTFLLMIKKEDVNLFDVLSFFLVFLAVGICFGQIITVILYAKTITNIIYCIGALLFGCYAILSTYKKTNYNHFAYLLAMITLFVTFIL